MRKEVPIWEKRNLTLEEAVMYSSIEMNKLRKMTDRKEGEEKLHLLMVDNHIPAGAKLY